MSYIKPEAVSRAKQMDLLAYLQNYEPHELLRVSSNVYSTRTHDSLKISNGKWCWHSRGIGGRSALDYLIKVKGMDFLDAVEQILGQVVARPDTAAPLKNTAKRRFVLPVPDSSLSEVERYLSGRGIKPELIDHCIGQGLLYQTKNKGYVNAVFVGFDKEKIPRYATLRGTRGNFKGDVGGSDKRYSFALSSGSENLHLFESAVDLLSFITLQGVQDPRDVGGDLLSLAGIFKPKQGIAESSLPLALVRYLKDHTNVKRIRLHLDNDPAGRSATKAIMSALTKEYEVTDDPPAFGKDYNDYLCESLRSVRRGPTARGRER